MTARAEFVYRYASPSRVDEATRPELRLSTCDADGAAPFLYAGAVRRPRLTAQLLDAVARVVESRHHVPPAMLARILLESDPVVTCGDGRVRFEGFSACAGLHVMTTLLPDALEAEIAHPGTTNVDFNAPMRAALAHVRDADGLRLCVGTDAVAIESAGTSVVERRVDLPGRWLRSFAEVQVVLARMERRLEFSGAAAARLVRSLPRSSTAKSTLFVSRAGGAARLRAVRSPGAVPIVGVERLRVLEPLAPLCDRAVLFADDAGASAWMLDFGDRQFVLTVSPAVWRGFSGEGGLLATLADPPAAALVARVHAALRWRSGLDAAELAVELGASPSEVARCLTVLAARGIVGHDVADAASFHRELPFDLARVAAQQKRLVNAQALVDGIEALGEGRFRVPSAGVAHTVTQKGGDEYACSCTWYARHAGERGPCKHVLAVTLRALR